MNKRLGSVVATHPVLPNGMVRPKLLLIQLYYPKLHKLLLTQKRSSVFRTVVVAGFADLEVLIKSEKSVQSVPSEKSVPEVLKINQFNQKADQKKRQEEARVVPRPRRPQVAGVVRCAVTGPTGRLDVLNRLLAKQLKIFVVWSANGKKGWFAGLGQQGGAPTMIWLEMDG